MQKICITTVGTSLLTNYNRYKAGGGINNVQEYMFENPVKASAETNSLQKLLETKELESGDKIILLTTHTDKAQECAGHLKEFAENKLFLEVEIEILAAWNTEGKISAQALSELTRKIIEIVEPYLTSVYTQKNVIINATGGYKALTSYASIIGLMCGLNVYYIHEEHSAIMTLPPMPLAWDYSLIVDYEEFFAWLSAEIRAKAEVDKQLIEIKQNLISETGDVDSSTYRVNALEMCVYIDERDEVMLSPAGEVLYGKYRALSLKAMETPIEINAEVYTRISARADTKAVFERELAKIRVAEFRRMKAEMKEGSPDILIFGNKKDKYRIAYSEEGNIVKIYDVLAHGDKSYENALDKKNICRADFAHKKYIKI